MKKYLLIFHNSPFAASTNYEGLEFAMALASFDQPVSLLFLEDSVLQLISGKQSNLIEYKDYTKALTGLELFGIDQVYAEQTAVDKYNLDINTLLIKPGLINTTEISSLIADFDIVVNV